MIFKAGQKVKVSIANDWKVSGIIIGPVIPDHYRVKIDDSVFCFHEDKLRALNVGYEWSSEKI
jgi:hypothetical protein